MDEASADLAGRLARDWATIWQSELAALGTDPETGMAVEAVLAAWLRVAEFWRMAVQSHDSARRDSDGRLLRSRADASSGPATAAVAPGPGHDAVARLERRVAELERRLAELEPEHGRDALPGDVAA